MKFTSITIDGVKTEVELLDENQPSVDMFALFQEKFGQGSNFSYLMHTSIGNVNARSALKKASVDELKAVLAFLPQKGNKTKIKAIQAVV